MKTSIFNHLYILLTILLTVYGQLILKWRISNIGVITDNKFKLLITFFLDPLILSGFFSAFLASLTWMLAMTKFELSYAYPFMALNFVVVVVLSALLLNDQLTLLKAIGIGLIVLGTIIAAKG